MKAFDFSWSSDKGNDIQDGDFFNYRFPIETVLLIVVICSVYLIENHPPSNINHGSYIVSSFSVYSFSQLVGEIAILFVGGFIAEQFIRRWKMMLFYFICTPFTVYIAEVFGGYNIVEGMSGGTMGLIGFGLCCIIWYLVEDKESESTFMLMMGGVIIASILLLSALYGYSVSHLNIYAINGWYSPHTSYIAHITGGLSGIAWWMYEHYSVNTV